ncbi:unnamed protein product [Caenorhabditis sp. 36 PRJEB53466]|nr:unnamed protein product [Caenorhabditis sp. 36 PRJEB53466]
MLHSLSATIFLIFCAQLLVLGCPPQPNGNCYYGEYALSKNQGGFQNQQCGQATNRDWCAVSYQPATQTANFGCASTFPIEVGGQVCGEGAFNVNQQGCSMVQTINGPCYFCCCKGGSCNHPQIFAREASKLPINNQLQQNQMYSAYDRRQSYYPMGWYNTASQPSNPFLLVAIILIILLVFSRSV